MDKFNAIPKTSINNLPNTAGVYFFYEENEIIYIGKAINIKERVRNHFHQPSYRDKLFIEKVTQIGFIETGSEIEALILEANLIKKHLPKFNVVWRDDKNYFYVAITKSEKPMVFVTHQKNKLHTEYLGPFVEGNALKKTVKYLRRVFPFYTTAKHTKNQCTWCHLGLCPGPNPDVREYQKNIKKLVLILQGKRKNARNDLKKEMKERSLQKKFEDAARIRDKIISLERIMEHTKVIERSEVFHGWEKTEIIIKGLLQIADPIARIECYDISNIQGKQAVGSMVVFKNGKPDKSQYRKFKIRMKQEPNDIAMLKEVLERRFHNLQWKIPEIMLIDGGIAQLNVAIKTKNQYANTKKIKIISIAKGRQELFIENRKEPIGLKNLPQEIYNLVKHLDDEAHRFAIAYHKKLRKKALGLDRDYSML